MRNPRRFTQGQLFDDSSYAQEQHVGDLPLDEWRQRPDVSFHGSYRRDFLQAPTIHTGEEGTAASRLLHAALSMRAPAGRRMYYTSSPMEDASLPTEHVGRVHAFRRTTPEHPVHNTMRASGDANANAADMHFWLSQGHGAEKVPLSIQDSAIDHDGDYIHPVKNGDRIDTSDMPGRAVEAARALEEGKSLSYENTVEGGKSFVSRPRTLRTWEDDVLESPNRSGLAKQYARQRITQGLSGSVDFDPDLPGLTTHSMIQPPLDYERSQGLTKPVSESPIFGTEVQRTVAPRRRVSEVRLQTKP